MKFIQYALLFNLIVTGIAIYLAIPAPKIQKCIVFQYNITAVQALIDNKLQPAIINEQRMYCIDIDKGEK